MGNTIPERKNWERMSNAFVLDRRSEMELTLHREKRLIYGRRVV